MQKPVRRSFVSDFLSKNDVVIFFPLALLPRFAVLALAGVGLAAPTTQRVRMPPFVRKALMTQLPFVGCAAWWRRRLLVVGVRRVMAVESLRLSLQEVVVVVVV